MNPAIILESVLGQIVGKSLNREDVPISRKDVPAATAKVVKDIKDAVADQQMAIVPINSGWFSKLNWKSIIALIAAIFALFGIDVSPAQQVAILGGLIAVSEIASIIIRTWFTKSVTASSMKGS